MHPVLAYHEASKHQLNQYAPGPGELDWATQPNPFRWFVGAEQLNLPFLEGELPAKWNQLGDPSAIPACPLNITNIAHLLQLSLGISAWKRYGNSRWALRCNPSSGNLHPTEAYLISPELEGLEAGVYHYQPETHQLEHRAQVPLVWQGGFFVALTSIHWREAWKYGIRAFRYCQHDCGHALAALSYSAGALGWQARLLIHWSDEQIAEATGIARKQDFSEAELESPEALVWIGFKDPPSAETIIQRLKAAKWTGQANRLSLNQREWPDIPRVSEATMKPSTQIVKETAFPSLPPLLPTSSALVSQLVRQRRSAQSFDQATAISANQFFRMMDALLPRSQQPPWSLLSSPPAVHLVLFVHVVEGLPSGLYCLVRDPKSMPDLKGEMDDGWLWQAVKGCPSYIPLYLLSEVDAREFAKVASCHQDIASQSAFSLAMLACFDDIVPDHPWKYPWRFREAGMIGQVLYLEAEAAGVQGTGIGCYFDNVVHKVLGLKSGRYQDVYHFTVGKAVIDHRIQSERPYSSRRD